MYLSVPIVLLDTPLDVAQCIEDFSTEECLEGNNAWYCETCKARVEAKKKIELWKLPPVLIIHLKRFSFGIGDCATKVSINVDFPLLDLDLTPFCRSPQRDLPIYDCYAVINHHGSAGMGNLLILRLVSTWDLRRTLYSLCQESSRQRLALLQRLACLRRNQEH